MNKLVIIGILLSLLSANSVQASTVSPMTEVAVSLEKNYDSPDETIYQKPFDIYGTSKPKTVWDLGANNYTVQFVMDSAIYTNVMFSNHSGEIYLDLTTTSTKDQALICELYAEGEDMAVTSATIDCNGSWNVRFYNLDTSKNIM